MEFHEELLVIAGKLKLCKETVVAHLQLQVLRELQEKVAAEIVALLPAPAKPASLDHLGTAPLPVDDRPPADQVERTLTEIREMLDDERYQYAADTLEGIRDNIEKRRMVSVAQARAVANIKAGGERHRNGGGGSRRHEGFAGRLR